MKTTAAQTGGCGEQALGFSSRVVRWTTVLGGILLFSLLQNPSPAFSALPTVPLSVTMAWDGSVSPDIAGYRVYYGAASGNYTSSIQVGNVTTGTIPGLTPGVTYFFAVNAYNLAGLESPFSNEVSYTPGLPTLQMRITAAGQAVLTVTGLAGLTYEIQATQDFKIWTAIGSVLLGAGGSIEFTDPTAAMHSSRFYRAQVLQP